MEENVTSNGLGIKRQKNLHIRKANGGYIISTERYEEADTVVKELSEILKIAEEHFKD